MSCYSHMENEGYSSLTRAGYNCPQCGSRYCELPVECKQCGLTLVSAPHLARSYHHLFPLKPFIEREVTTIAVKVCFACAKAFGRMEKHVKSAMTQFLKNYDFMLKPWFILSRISMSFIVHYYLLLFIMIIFLVF